MIRRHRVKYTGTHQGQHIEKLEHFIATRADEDPALYEIKRAALEAIGTAFPYATEQTLQAKSRKRELVMVRQIFHQLLYSELQDIFSLKALGHMTGGRDHSTVINSRQAVSDLLATDREFNRKYRHALEVFRTNLEYILDPAAGATYAPAVNFAPRAFGLIQGQSVTL